MRYAVLLCGLLGATATGCGGAGRHRHVSVLPRTGHGSGYPAADALDVVAIDAGEGKSLAKPNRASPCDRHARFVATDALALVNEAFRALASEHGRRVEARCSPETVRLVIGERELDLDFLRAAVERDAQGKLVRALGFSARSGRLARAVFHLERKLPSDGIVVVDVQRYMPTEIGPVYFYRVEDREELYVTSKADAERKGLYVVSRARGSDDELEIGVARYVVK